jgi:hypothetical protein
VLVSHVMPTTYDAGLRVRSIAISLGIAGAALAAPGYVTPTHDAVYSTHPDSANIRPVDCSVHVSSGGTDVNVNWC